MSAQSSILLLRSSSNSIRSGHVYLLMMLPAVRVWRTSTRHCRPRPWAGLEPHSSHGRRHQSRWIPADGRRRLSCPAPVRYGGMREIVPQVCSAHKITRSRSCLRRGVLQRSNPRAVWARRALRQLPSNLQLPRIPTTSNSSSNSSSKRHMHMGSHFREETRIRTLPDMGPEPRTRRRMPVQGPTRPIRVRLHHTPTHLPLSVDINPQSKTNMARSMPYRWDRTMVAVK